MDLSPSAEVELVSRVASGDAAAMNEVYSAYSRPVYSMAYGILRDHNTAEDVTQEVFKTLWQRASTYDPARGPFKHWFLHLAHNRVIDELRRRKREAQRDARKSLDEVTQGLAAPDDPAEAAVQAVLFGKVEKALQELPPEQRTVVVMAYLQGATQREIADRTGVPLGTVKTRLRLAIIKLRQRFAEPERKGV